jgi:hypothetical protein
MFNRGDLETVKIGGIRLVVEDSYHRLLNRSRVTPKQKTIAE